MKISNCCSAGVAYIEKEPDGGEIGICMDCKEHCDVINEYDEEMTLGSMDRF